MSQQVECPAVGTRYLRQCAHEKTIEQKAAVVRLYYTATDSLQRIFVFVLSVKDRIQANRTAEQVLIMQRLSLNVSEEALIELSIFSRSQNIFFNRRLNV